MAFRLFNLGTTLGSVRVRRVNSTQEIEGVGELSVLGLVRIDVGRAT